MNQSCPPLVLRNAPIWSPSPRVAPKIAWGALLLELESKLSKQRNIEKFKRNKRYKTYTNMKIMSYHPNKEKRKKQSNKERKIIVAYFIREVSEGAKPTIES